MFSSWFGITSISPEEQLQQWKELLRKERLSLESANRMFDRLEQETKVDVKNYVKLGETQAARILCRAICDVRRARERNLIVQMQIKSVENMLSQHVAMSKMTKALQMSTNAMHAMNALVRIPEVAEAAKQLGQEMKRAGFIQDVMNESIAEDKQIEEESNDEVERVLEEIAAGIYLPQAISLPTTKPVSVTTIVKEPVLN